MPSQLALSSLAPGAQGQAATLRPQRMPSVMGRRGQWVPPDHPDAMNDPMQTLGAANAQGGQALSPEMQQQLQQRIQQAQTGMADASAQGQWGGALNAASQLQRPGVMPQHPEFGSYTSPVMAQPQQGQPPPQVAPPPAQRGGGFLGLGNLPGLGFLRNAPVPPGVGSLPGTGWMRGSQGGPPPPQVPQGQPPSSGTLGALYQRLQAQGQPPPQMPPQQPPSMGSYSSPWMNAANAASGGGFAGGMQQRPMWGQLGNLVPQQQQF